MKRYRLRIIPRQAIFFGTLLIAMTAASAAFGAETAAQLLTRCSARISKAGGIQASFKMTGAASASGTLYSQGRQFALISNASSSWYDGQHLWTYNPSTNETTLVKPTASEIREANPLSFVGAASQFNAAYAKTSPAGTKTVVLTPKSKKLGVKSVSLTLNVKTLLPSKIVVVPSSGKAITLSITGIATGKKFAASTFKYPSKKYPKATLVDLR